MRGRTNPEEVEREVRRLKDERLRHAEEARELKAAGWEQRGSGPKSLWRRSEGRRWWAHHQALIEMRKQRFDARVDHPKPGGGE